MYTLKSIKQVQVIYSLFLSICVLCFQFHISIHFSPKKASGCFLVCGYTLFKLLLTTTKNRLATLDIGPLIDTRLTHKWVSMMIWTRPVMADLVTQFHKLLIQPYFTLCQFYIVPHYQNLLFYFKFRRNFLFYKYSKECFFCMPQALNLYCLWHNYFICYWISKIFAAHFMINLWLNIGEKYYTIIGVWRDQYQDLLVCEGDIGQRE